MIILRVNDLSKHYGENVVLDRIGFTVEEGERMGLVGPNGAGKTTLLRILTGQLEADGGSFAFSGSPTIGYLEQTADLDSQSTVWDELIKVYAPVFAMEQRMRELEQLMSALGDESQPSFAQYAQEYSRLMESFEAGGGYGYRSAIAGVLAGLGLGPETHQQPIWQLSGGQRSRVALARLLLTRPQILLLDEPTNHLDLEATAWLENHLRSFPGTVIVVSHDRWFLDAMCSTIGELSFGRLTSYRGNYTQYLEQREERYAQALKSYTLNQREIKRMEGIIARYRSFNREKSIKAARSWEKRLDKMERVDRPRTEQGIRFQLDTARKSGNDVLITENLSMEFPGRKLFAGLDLHLRTGDRVALIGPNGVGKTTLLRILAGQLPPSGGTFLLGAGVSVGYYDQQQADLAPQKTVMDEVWDAYPRMEPQQVRDALAAFLFRGDDIYRKISECSGGEKGRIALLKLMLNKGNLLLLDEPTNHLDMDSRQVLEEALEDFPGTVIIVSHDRYFINQTANRILEMNPDGFVQYPGNWESYLYHQSVAKSKVQDSGSAVSRTAAEKQRKKDREARQALKQLRAAVADREREITDTEAKVAALEEALSHPESFPDGQALSAAAREHAELQQQLNELMELWEQESSQLEQALAEGAE